jgi:hypothetical protein
MAQLDPAVMKRLGLIGGFAFEDCGCVQTNIPAHVAQEHKHLHAADTHRVANPRHPLVGVAYLAGIATLVKAFVKACYQLRHALRGL